MLNFKQISTFIVIAIAFTVGGYILGESVGENQAASLANLNLGSTGYLVSQTDGVKTVDLLKKKDSNYFCWYEGPYAIHTYVSNVDQSLGLSFPKVTCSKLLMPLSTTDTAPVGATTTGTTTTQIVPGTR